MYLCRYKEFNMDTVKINIELPSYGQYSRKELEYLVYSYAMTLIKRNDIDEFSVEDELKELKRRAIEMKNDPSVCIPIENVYDLVMERV